MCSSFRNSYPVHVCDNYLKAEFHKQEGKVYVDELLSVFVKDLYK